MAEIENKTLGSRVGDVLSTAGKVGAFANTFVLWILNSLFWVVFLFIIIGILFGFFGCLSFLPFGGNADQAESLGCAGNGAMRMIQIGGFMLGFFASTADFSLNRFVFKMGEYLGQGSGVGFAIETAWFLVRDLVNLAFIGGLIWAAISTILQTGEAIGKLVVQIIIAALLVNFSYFFAGVVIDGSNVISEIIYKEAIYAEGDVWGLGTPGEPDQIFGAKFMVATRLAAFYDFENIQNQVNTENVNEWSLLILAVAGTVLFATGAWVFLTFAGLLMNRFIVIIILLISSPIGILRFTKIPVVSEWGKAWWSALFSQAIFPPVFFLLLAISFKIIEAMNAQFDETIGGSQFVDLLQAGSVTQANFGIFITYAIAIGLMYASAKIAVNIARQAPTEVPKTGAVYDFRKTAIPAVQKGFAGTLGLLGKVGSLPSFNDTNKNLGDRIFRGNVWRDNIVAPLGRALDPLKRRDFVVSQARQEAYHKALLKLGTLKEGDAGYEDALADATEKYQLLRPAERAWVDDHELHERKDHPEKYGAEKDHRKVQQNAVEGSAFVRQQRRTNISNTATTPLDEKTQKALQAIDQDIKKSDTREAARDALARQQGLMDVAKEQTTAEATLRVARNSKHGVSILPEAFLTHSNVTPHLTLSDATVLAGDATISDEAFNRIADTWSDKVHEQFLASLAAKLRPGREPRVRPVAEPNKPPTGDNGTAMGPGESQARGGGK